MPRKIANTICNLDEEFSAMGQETCPMCGAVRGENGETDIPEHGDFSVVRELALFMADDWKACCILLLYVASPNAPIREIEKQLYPNNEDREKATDVAYNPRLRIASICNARQRAAQRFPTLSGMLGLKTPHALAQQARHAAETGPQGDLFQ